MRIILFDIHSWLFQCDFNKLKSIKQKNEPDQNSLRTLNVTLTSDLSFLGDLRAPLLGYPQHSGSEACWDARRSLPSQSSRGSEAGEHV